jgi:hypothetical protein
MIKLKACLLSSMAMVDAKYQIIYKKDFPLNFVMQLQKPLKIYINLLTMSLEM